MKPKIFVLINILLILTMLFPLAGFAANNYETNSSENIFLPLVLNKFFPIPDNMVLVPEGEFQMGCDPVTNGGSCSTSRELPLHTVYLDAYKIDISEVTNAQYVSFLNERGSNDCGDIECVNINSSDIHISLEGSQYVVDDGYENHPMNEATWNGSDAYCKAIGKRLPSEAEWEKAARGSNDTRKFPWGNEEPDCTLANFWPSSGCVVDTSPVGSYPLGASPYGALDMSGNVMEWVNDWFDSDYYSVSPYSNPHGPDNGTEKVLRGGGWFDQSYYIRVAYRASYTPDTSFQFFGFRCAVDAP